MRSASISVVVGIAIAAGGVAPRASAMVGPASSAGAEDEPHRAEGNARMDEGDAHQAAGAHAEAARAYAKAFDAFALRSKSDAKETQAVGLAVDEFKAAQDQEPRSLALLEEEAALLDRFIARTKDDAALVEEHTRVNERIEALKAEHAAAERRKREEEAKASQQEPAKPEAEAEPRNTAPTKSHLRLRGEAAAIAASGFVGIVGGAALVGAGGWTLGTADKRRDAQLAALEANEYPNEAGIRDDLDLWHQRGRGIGAGLLVSGAVLAAAGIGLAAWGVVKLRKAGKGSGTRASVVLPMVGAEGVAVVARVAF